MELMSSKNLTDAPPGYEDFVWDEFHGTSFMSTYNVGLVTLSNFSRTVASNDSTSVGVLSPTGREQEVSKLSDKLVGQIQRLLDKFKDCRTNSKNVGQIQANKK